MKVSGDWLERDETQEVMALLGEAGHVALVVGGAVRNAIRHEPVQEVDIATSARPERVMELARAAGLKALPTGLSHGTVTVIAAGIPHEITTFRRDVETDGRHAVISFSDRIEEDAARRDFTMNALYAARDGQVIDPLGSGAKDAVAGHVRFIGRPEDRIHEDYLRILRFFRFFAWYGGRNSVPDPDALAACAALAAGLGGLSQERIGAEMKKLLSAPDPAMAVVAMESAGILEWILPGSDATALPALIRLEAERAPRWQRRLALLGGTDPATCLRLSRAEAGDQRRLQEGLTANETPAALGFLLGEELAKDAMLIRAALSGQSVPDAVRAEIQRGAAARFPIQARDLMPAFGGPALGRQLRHLTRLWLDSDLVLSRAALLDNLAPEPEKGKA